jgi:hypothetical protein
MSITALADRAVTVYRRTAFVLDAAAAVASPAISRQPAKPALVEVLVEGGAAGTGTVVVSGTVNGSPESETLTFVGPARKVTTKRFSALSSFATTGLANESPPPTLSARAVGGDGGSIDRDVLVVSAWPMRKDAGAPSWPAPVQGSAEQELTYFYVDYTTIWTPREGDVFVDDRTSEQWQVVGHPAQHGGGLRTPHHHEIRVRRREGSRQA